MACMEHWCRSCNHMEFNNSHMLICPKCGAEDISSTWDDQEFYRDDDRDDDCDSEGSDDE